MTQIRDLHDFSISQKSYLVATDETPDNSSRKYNTFAWANGVAVSNVNVTVTHRAESWLDLIPTLYRAFINQRKIHRYYVASQEHTNDEITDEEFERIENSCILKSEKLSDEKIMQRVISLFNMIKDHNPEEVDFMEDEDMADFLSIPTYKLQDTKYKYFITKDLPDVGRTT